MQDFLVLWALLVAIIWARYFVIAGLFHFLLWGRPEDKVRARKLAKRRPTREVVQHEITMSLTTSLIYALPGAIVMTAYQAGGTAIYAGPLENLAGIVYLPISLLIYLFLHDTYFYWSHRVMHAPALFRATHLTHHRSRHPTPWAAFSFHPYEAIISAWLLPLAAFFIPIHIGVVFTLLIVMTYASVANHAGWEIVPRPLLDGRLGRWLITASHHNVHHTDYDANYGLYFRFWDRLCGTDKGLARPQPTAVETA